MQTRSQTRNYSIQPIWYMTRSHAQYVRKNPHTSVKVNQYVNDIKLILNKHNSIGKSTHNVFDKKVKITYELMDYILDIERDLYILGPCFCRVILDKLNEFMFEFSDYNEFIERLSMYKRELLPYLT